MEETNCLPRVYQVVETGTAETSLIDDRFYNLPNKETKCSGRLENRASSSFSIGQFTVDRQYFTC